MGGGWGGRLLTFSAFRMGAYSRLALIRGWALIRVNTVFSRRFLKQNYPKCIGDVLSKILEEKEQNYHMFCLNL